MFIHYFTLTPHSLHVLQETVLLVWNHWLTGTPKWNAAIVKVTPADSKFKIEFNLRISSPYMLFLC